MLETSIFSNITLKTLISTYLSVTPSSLSLLTHIEIVSYNRKGHVAGPADKVAGAKLLTHFEICVKEPDNKHETLCY